jgi:hypothetical protein
MKKLILVTVFVSLSMTAPGFAAPLGEASNLQSVPASRTFDLSDKANVYAPVSRKINAEAHRGFRSNASSSGGYSPIQRIPHGNHEDLLLGTQPDTVPIATVADW